nr:hypothetical protein [Tanacetum cinerariifolium]
VGGAAADEADALVEDVAVIGGAGTEQAGVVGLAEPLGIFGHRRIVPGIFQRRRGAGLAAGIGRAGVAGGHFVADPALALILGKIAARA